MKDYLFVRIPKTASTSICHALQRVVEHKTALEWKKELGRKWEHKLTFSVIRNPYDRFISMYYFFSVFGRAYKENGFIKKQDINRWLSQHEIKEIESDIDYKFVKPQSDFLYDQNGKLLVQWLIKFEELERRWEQLLSDLGREFVPLPHKRKWFLRPDNVVLSQASKDKIYEYYTIDFELLGYKR